MAKFHYEQRTFQEGFLQSSIPNSPPPLNTRIASRLTTDTYVRSIHQVRVGCEVDTSTSPPVDNWWQGSRVTFAVRFDAAGVSGAGTGPFAATCLGTQDLYPRITRHDATDALDQIVWEPIGGPLVLQTARKGDGVHFPRINTSLWTFDHNAVFLNGGGLYTVSFWWQWTTTVIWASDSP